MRQSEDLIRRCPRRALPAEKKMSGRPASGSNRRGNNREWDVSKQRGSAVTRISYGYLIRREAREQQIAHNLYAPSVGNQHVPTVLPTVGSITCSFEDEST